jgi:hypothetical protein
MYRIFIPVLDLLSKKTFTNSTIENERGKIIEKSEDLKSLVFLSDLIQIRKDGRIEIYAEDVSIKDTNEEDLINSIKYIENQIGGFITGSYFEVENKSGEIEKFEKTEFSWESEYLEEDESDWRSEWDEWNDE